MSKTKMLKKTIKDQNLVNMFNQMLCGDGDPEIVTKKLSDIRGYFQTIAKITKEFATGPISTGFPEYKSWCDEFMKFSDDTAALVEKEYKEIKDHNQTRQLILVCRELIVYMHFLQPPLNDKWVLSHPGLVFEPFAFTKMDVKHIWNNDAATPNVKKYCMHVISILFNKCHEIYKIITSPDVDVKKFSKIIIESIDKVRYLPELNRCKDAFEKIKESVDLLENNFTDYYKDMVQSENPNTIIENFIIDVSQGQNMNIELMRQFRIVINFYKKQSSGKIKDPKVKQLFDTLSSRMDILEKKVVNETTEEDSSSDEDVNG